MRISVFWMVAPLLALAAAPAMAQTLVRSYNGPMGSGFAVAETGDLDGDGRRDFVSGAVGDSVVVAYSSAALAPLWSSQLAGSNFGFAVSSAGDVNGDGVEDVVGGAPAAGIARVLDGRNGAILYSLTAPAGSGAFGAAVGALGDVDGDGRADFLVTAPNGAGEAFVYSGRTGTELARATGTESGAMFGAGVAGLSDIDGDGRPDFVVGAPRANAGLGRAYVFSGATRARLFELAPLVSGGGTFGQFFVADAGDTNADGFTDIYVGAYAETLSGAAYVFSGRDGSRLHRIGGNSSEGLGPGRGAGDVDGDGRADLIIGGYIYSGAGLPQGGRITLFSGADASVIARVDGTRPGGQFGFDAVGVGDVTGDGRVDFIVSSPPANTVDLYAGAGAVLAVDEPLQLNGGLSGPWYEPATSGQGFVIEVNTAARIVAGAWFTYDSLSPAAGGQRWFQVVGPYTDDTATLDVILSEGGAFDQPTAPSNQTIGTLQLRFLDCTHAAATYAVRENAISGSGAATEGALRQGTIALQRLTPDVGCAGASRR